MKKIKWNEILEEGDILTRVIKDQEYKYTLDRKLTEEDNDRLDKIYISKIERPVYGRLKVGRVDLEQGDILININQEKNNVWWEEQYLMFETQQGKIYIRIK